MFKEFVYVINGVEAKENMKSARGISSIEWFPIIWFINSLINQTKENFQWEELKLTVENDYFPLYEFCTAKSIVVP